MNSWIAELLHLVYPQTCVVCTRLLKAQEECLCSVCAGRIIPLGPNACRLCARTISNHDVLICLECQRSGKYYSNCYALTQYEGVVKELIHQLKYSKNKEVLKVLVPWINRFCERDGLVSYDRVVPVPMYWMNRIKRGIDHTVCIAEYVAHNSSAVVVTDALVKHKNTGQQVKKDRKDRLEHIKGSFQCRKTKKIRDRKVLLVDDVYTTGATVNECARVLAEAGAASVDVFVLARG